MCIYLGLMRNPVIIYCVLFLFSFCFLLLYTDEQSTDYTYTISRADATTQRFQPICDMLIQHLSPFDLLR